MLVAMVTGGSSGIGLEIARTLAAEGFALSLVARREGKLVAAAEALREDGAEVNPIAADVSEAEAISKAMANHSATYGRLDVLVNNAGMGVPGPIENVSTKLLDLQLSVDLRAVILFYKVGLDLLLASARENGSSLVINTASIAGKEGRAHLGVYSAVKHGLVGFSASMNRELGPRGIKSTALCPAFVDTALADVFRDQVPARTMIQPSDIGEAVRFLVRTSANCLVPEIAFLQKDDPEGQGWRYEDSVLARSDDGQPVAPPPGAADSA